MDDNPYTGLPKCQDCGWKLGTKLTDNCSCRGDSADHGAYTKAYDEARRHQEKEMSNITSINGQPPEEPEDELPIIILDEAYQKALLGNSVSPLEPPRAVYSLPLLVILEKKRLLSNEEVAQKSILSMLREVYKQHPDRAPHFVDDSMRRKKKESRIIRPGGRRF